MANYQIELPDVHTINRAGVAFEFDVARLSADMVQELVLHGLTQKIGDAAAGAKGNADEARGMMAKVADALLAGNWGTKREGGGRVSDPVARAALALATLEFDANPKKKATIAAVAAKYDVNAAKARAMVLKKMAERPETMERARAQVAANIGLDVELGDLGL